MSKMKDQLQENPDLRAYEDLSVADLLAQMGQDSKEIVNKAHALLDRLGK